MVQRHDPGFGLCYCCCWRGLRTATACLQEPFLVWTETPSGGTPNFLTGAGSVVQSPAVAGCLASSSSSSSLRLIVVVVFVSCMCAVQAASCRRCCLATPAFVCGLVGELHADFARACVAVAMCHIVSSIGWLAGRADGMFWSPLLFENVGQVTLRGVAYLGNRLDVTYDSTVIVFAVSGQVRVLTTLLLSCLLPRHSSHVVVLVFDRLFRHVCGFSKRSRWSCLRRSHLP